MFERVRDIMTPDVETLEIQADVPHGVPDRAFRTIIKNRRVLELKTQGFETE